MDLQNISSQMRNILRKHQLIVTELKSDPQNPILLKRLHDVECEIRCLDDKQKQVVDGLRKLSSQNASSPNCIPNVVTSSPSKMQNPLQGNQITSSAQKSPIANHKLPTTTIVTKPVANCINTVRQTVPPTINNIATPTAATFTFKAPVGTVVLPNCSTTASTLLTSKVADNHKMHPLLVVPSPSNRTADGPQTGVLLNLVPPIRVPQYPPPSLPRMPGPITCQKNPVLNNCIPVAIASTSAGFQQFNVNSDSNLTSSSESPPISSSEKRFSSNSTVESNVEKKKKLDFLAALGLVSKDSLLDIKNKKTERKRRSTANPQFSNAAIEEKMRNATTTQPTTTPQRRPRGRPRLESKPVVCPTNGISQNRTTEMKMSDAQIESNNVNCTSSVNSSPSSESAAVVNGIHKPVVNAEEGKNVEQMLSGLCIVCTQPGDLVKCDTCAKQQHLGCMQPPLIARPQIPWQCSECQSRTVSLTVVQNYDMLKAAKEDEKRKLLKKSLELRLKRSQLEGRLNQLKEYSNNQKNRQSELESSLKGTETLVGRINSVINGVRLCS